MDADENKPTSRTGMRRKSSNRRSSILKKRPLTPLNTSDSDVTEKTTALRTRGKRVSFSETYEVKLFPKDSPKQWMNEINHFNDVADQNKQESEKALEASEVENTLAGLNSLLTAQINQSLLSGQPVLEQEQNQITRSCQPASKLQEDDCDQTRCNPDDVELTSCRSGVGFQSKLSSNWEETTTKVYSASTLEVIEFVQDISVKQSLLNSDILRENEQTLMFDGTVEMTRPDKIDASEIMISLDTKTPNDPNDNEVEQSLAKAEETKIFDDGEEDLNLTCTLSPSLAVCQNPAAAVTAESAIIFADDKNEHNWPVSIGKGHIVQDGNEQTEAFNETMELTPCEVRAVVCAKPVPRTSTLVGQALSLIPVETPEKIDATSFLMSLAAKEPNAPDEGETEQSFPSPKAMAFNDSDEDLSLTCTLSPSLAACHGQLAAVMTGGRAVFAENEQLSKGVTLGFSTPDKIDARTFLNSLTAMSSKDARRGPADVRSKTNVVDETKWNCASDRSLTQMCADKENDYTQVFSEPMEMTECIALSECQPSEQIQVGFDDSNETGTPGRLTAGEKTRIFDSEDVNLSLTCVQPVHLPPAEVQAAASVDSGSIPAEEDKRPDAVAADRTVIFEHTGNAMELTKVQSVGVEDQLLRSEASETETSQPQATPTDQAGFRSMRTTKPYSVSQRTFKSQSVSLRKGLSESIFLKRSHAETKSFETSSSQVNACMTSFTKANNWPSNTKTSRAVNDDDKLRSSVSSQSLTQMCVNKENDHTQVFSEPMEMTECMALSECQPSEQIQLGSDDSNETGTPGRLTAGEKTRIFDSEDVNLSLTCVQPVHLPPAEVQAAASVDSGSIPAEEDKRPDAMAADRTVIFEHTGNAMELTKVQSVGVEDQLLRSEASETETSQPQATPTDQAGFRSMRTNKPYSVSQRTFKSQSVSLRKGLSESIFLKRSHAETKSFETSSSQVNACMTSSTKAKNWPSNTKTSRAVNEDDKLRSSVSSQSLTQMCVNKENDHTQVFSEPMEMTECMALSECQPSEQIQVGSDVDSGSIPAEEDKRPDAVAADRTVIFEHTGNAMELTKVQSVGVEDQLLRSEASETETTPSDQAEFSSVKTSQSYSAPPRTSQSESHALASIQLECTLQASQSESVSLKKDHPETISLTRNQPSRHDVMKEDSAKSITLYSGSLESGESETLDTNQSGSVSGVSNQSETTERSSLGADHLESSHVKASDSDSAPLGTNPACSSFRPSSSEGSPTKHGSKRPRMETTFSSAPPKLNEDSATANPEGIQKVARSESRSLHEESLEFLVADQMASTFTMSAANMSWLVTNSPADDDSVINDSDGNASKSVHFSVMRDRTMSAQLEETSVFLTEDNLDYDSQPTGGSCEVPSIKNDLTATNPDSASNHIDTDVMTADGNHSPRGSTSSGALSSGRKRDHDSASDKDADIPQAFFNNSQFSRSATGLDKSSVIRFLGDESEQILMPEYDVKSVDDWLNVFGVIIPRKVCSRNSVTRIPVDVPQTLSDCIKLEVTRSELEISVAAQHQLSDLIDKYRDLNVKMEEEIGPKLPGLMEKMLANFNENFERTQKLSAACSKKVKKYLKEWKLDVLRQTLAVNTDEKERLTRVRQQLCADLSEVEQATEQMKQKLCELDQLKVAEEQLKEEEAELVRKKTELAEKRAELAAVQGRHQKIEENITEFKALQAKYSKENIRPLKEKADRLLRCVAYQLLCLQSDHIVLSFLDQSLVLDIEMETPSRSSSHHIKRISFSSVIKESNLEQSHLKEIYSTKLVELCHRIIRRSLPEGRLTGLSTAGYEFRKVLVDLSVLTNEVERWMKYLRFVAVKHRLTYTDSSVTIMFSNREVDAMFQVTFDLDLSNFLTAAPKVTAKRILGSIQPDDVLPRLSSIKRGPDFIKTAVRVIYTDVMRVDSKLFI